MSPSLMELFRSENQPAEMDFEAAKLKDFGQEMGGAGETSASRSKPRMVWTNDLNNKFLEAIRALGHKAFPKDIAQFMGVPGLSRKLVASHLQDFLRSEKDPINRDVSILGSGGLLGLQYLTPSIRQYQEPWARISSAVNLNFSSNLNRVSQANLLLSAGSGSSSSPTVGLNLHQRAVGTELKMSSSIPTIHLNCFDHYGMQQYRAKIIVPDISSISSVRILLWHPHKYNMLQ